ncbi:MAG: hypothetical protein HC915_20250 [Anaerolineae bacterium]|nr:hypothetical protein [Anaerolineae bacterium]
MNFFDPTWLELGMASDIIEPPHLDILLLNYLQGAEIFQSARMLVYAVEDFTVLSNRDEIERYQSMVERLRTLLAECPALESFAVAGGDGALLEEWPLALVPLFPAAQIFAVQPEYVEFEGGAGVRHLTCFAQDMAPLNAGDVCYTFQGRSEDGQTYVSIILLILAELPAGAEIDPQTFYPEGYFDDLENVVETLGALEAEAAQPDLAVLDALVASLELTLP